MDRAPAVNRANLLTPTASAHPTRLRHLPARLVDELLELGVRTLLWLVERSDHEANAEAK